MNYGALIKGLREEIKTGHQYKNLGSPYSALAFIAMLPFIIVTVSMFIGMYCLLFLYNAFLSGTQYLESWLDTNKKNLHPATEAVLYFCTIPTIFAMRVALSVFSLFFYFSWFNLMCSTYVSTLGGVRWQPFVSEATYDGVKFGPNTNETAAKAFAIIAFILLALCVLMFLIASGVDDRRDSLQISTVGFVIFAIDAAFVNISVPAIFKKKISSAEEEDFEELPEI